MATFFAPTPQYKAPTFQELAAPLEIYRQAYNSMEEKYDAQKEKAAMLQAMLGTDPDNELSQYMADYNALMNQTARGFSNGSLPYAQLYSNYQKLRDIWNDKGLKATAAIDAYTKYREAKSKTPGAIGPEYSLTDFLKNPQRAYTFINPVDVEKQSADLFKTISASMPPNVRGSFMNDAMVLMSQGMSANDIIGLMQQDSPYAPFVQNLQGFYGNEYADLDDESKRQYNMAIQRGAFAGLEQMKAVENPMLDMRLKQARLSAANLAYKDALIDYNNKVKLNNTWALSPEGYYVNGLGITSSSMPSDGVLVDYSALPSKKSKSDKETDPSVYSFEDVFGYPNVSMETSGSYTGYSYRDPNGRNAITKRQDLPAKGFSFYNNGAKMRFEPVVAYDEDGSLIYGFSKDVNKNIDHLSNLENGTIIGYGFENGTPTTNNINANGEYGMSKDIPRKVQKAIRENPALAGVMPNSFIMKTSSGNYVVLTQKR